jgi:hypothetical protein
MVAPERELAATAPQPADAIPPRLRRRGGSPRQVLVISLIGTVALSLFASRDLSTWAERLSGGPLAKEVQRVAAAWDEALTALGFTWPHDTLRSVFSRFLDCNWGDVDEH